MWSHDGKWIYYANLQHGYLNIYRKPSSGTGQAEPIFEGSYANLHKWPFDVSRFGIMVLGVAGFLVGAAKFG